jgi:hypothetical protein
MGQTMKNRGGGILSFLFGKRMTSGEKRQRSAELREKRLANIPGTPQNIRKQQIRRETRMNKNRASQKTRETRRKSLPGTVENIAHLRAKASASRLA